MMQKTTLTLLSALLLCTVRAQKLDHHDILLFSLSKGADSLWKPLAPRFLTAFNPKGYNNQPAFFSSQELYLSVQAPETGEQTDLYLLDLLTRSRTRVTNTPTTPEYSPTLMPGGRRFSAVRVDTDGIQRLWSFPLDRSDNGRSELPNMAGVGYHCWLRDTVVALFIVGEDNSPHTLQVVGMRSKKPQRVAANIGRCLQSFPDGRLAFVQKPTDQTWYLKTYDWKTGKSDILVKMPVGSEDFTILTDGTLLTGQGAKLFQFKPGRETDWKEVADLSKFGVKSITRMAASKDGKLAVVVQ